MTMVEILVVVGIIAILVGLLIPAVHTVQRVAKETKQKAQFTAIEMGLAAFKNDYGDFPPSSWYDPFATGTTTLRTYCGAQKLAEAMVGWDLLGFHPDSAWRANGLAVSPTGAAIANTVYFETDTLKKRKGRYVELDVANPFLLGGGVDALFPGTTGDLEPRTYVLCDVFTRSERKIRRVNGTMVAAGTPILYYKANPASLLPKPTAWANAATSGCIYDARDNAPILDLGWLGDASLPMGSRRKHDLAGSARVGMTGFEYFYDYYTRDTHIQDQNRVWPVRPDSYLLISAGMDGIYGTNDDIRNFGQ
ncbi:MAG: type II secretion system protein [Phycisphaerales bacterium]